MLSLFWIISLEWIYSISPDWWQTMASLAHLRANWLLFVKLPHYRRNNASILPQVIWMQPGRHTWAPWSLAIYRMWCMVQLFLCFLSVCFCTVFFQGLNSCQKKKKKKSWFDRWKVLPDFRLMAAPPSHPPNSPPFFTTTGCQMFEACDLFSSIVWYTCTHVFNVKRYCIVSKCFANTLAERRKEDSWLLVQLLHLQKNENTQKKNHALFHDNL